MFPIYIHVVLPQALCLNHATHCLWIKRVLWPRHDPWNNNVRTTTKNLIFLLGKKASACVCERGERDRGQRYRQRGEEGGADYGIDAIFFNISNKYVRVQNSCYIFSGLWLAGLKQHKLTVESNQQQPGSQVTLQHSNFYFNSPKFTAIQL